MMIFWIGSSHVRWPKDKIEEFVNLRQVSMTVKEYCLKFNQLSKYAPDTMANPRASMSKFVTGYLT